MSLWRQLTRGFRVLAKRKAAEQDISDEVAHYLDQATASHEADGLSPEDARRAVQQEFGNVTVVREQIRESGWENVIDTIITDFRYGCRRLAASPGFTLIAVLTLGLGIGASTAIFSTVNPVLFESLPYPEASRIMAIWDGENDGRLAVTFGTFREIVQRSRSFESIAVMRPLQVTLTGAAEPERIDGQYVSANYFRVLGVQPALGRDFRESDDRPWPQGPVVAVIGDALWHRRFGGDASIVGRQISIQDTPVTVIGVLPKGFENVLSPSAEIWATLQFDPSLPLNGREWGHQLRMVGRLKNGVQPEQARQELASIAQTRLPEFPRPGWALLKAGLTATSLQHDLTRSVRPGLLAIMGAVVLLLTIASVNVTNLLLARGAARAGEFAVRTALGASRWRLLRQLLTETMLLAACGGALGILLAYGAVKTVTALSPAELPRASSIQVDSAVLAFAVGLTVLIGLLIGAVPALHRADDLHSTVQRSSTRIAGGRQWTRRTLVVVQVALALVLLVHSGLLLRSVRRLFAEPAGFDAANVLSMQVQTAGRKFRDANETHRFFTEALEAVQKVPGVSLAAFTSQLPLTGDADLWGVAFESSPTPPTSEDGSTYRYAVSPTYFEVMRIPLKQGRVLDVRDVAGVPLAAVINESYAKRRFPGQNAIGQRIHIGPSTDPWFTIVGIVGDVKQQALDVNHADAVYVTAAQWSRFADNARWLVVRSSGDATSLVSPLRKAIWSINKDQPIVRVATMSQRLETSASQRRFALFLFEAFGIVAMVLASIGTYSLLSGDVAERTAEIGIRSALGASRLNIFALILRQGMILVVPGIAIGTIGAILSSRALVALLFDVSRLDSLTYLGVITLLAVMSALACAWPAWRAARIRPSVALKGLQGELLFTEKS